MKNICGVCNTEKKFDHNRGMYKRCGQCNIRYVMKHYNNNKDVVSEKNKNYYQNNKEYFREYNKKRYTKITDLQNQIKQLTEMLQTVSVS